MKSPQRGGIRGGFTPRFAAGILSVGYRIEGSLASALLLSIPIPRQFWSGKPRAEFA
jgi:hypothetical protein